MSKTVYLFFLVQIFFFTAFGQEHKELLKLWYDKPGRAVGRSLTSR